MKRSEFISRIDTAISKLKKRKVLTCCGAITAAFAIVSPRIQFQKLFKPDHAYGFSSLYFGECSRENVPDRVTSLLIFKEVILDSKEYLNF